MSYSMALATAALLVAACSEGGVSEDVTTFDSRETHDVTFGDVVADTSGVTDTAAPDDTTAPTDTATAADTTAMDTTAPADTTAAGDTTTPPDTADATAADDTMTAADTADTTVADDTMAAADTVIIDTTAPADTTVADDTMAATDTTDTTVAPPICTEYVVMNDDGQFELEGARYELKGINLHVAVAGLVDNADQAGLSPEDYDWRYFLVPYGNYFPHNYAACDAPWADDALCCADAASCRAKLIEEHIDRVVALDANSVRLVGLGPNITDDGRVILPCGRMWDGYAQRDKDAGRRCELDLSDAGVKARYFEIVREAVRLLGEHGIRTILLTGGKNADNGDNHWVYTAFMRELARSLEGEPWLLAYDPMNEPIYFYRAELQDDRFDCADGSFCKDSARAVSKDWFDALTADDKRHFVTVGAGATTLSLISWDPHVVFDHFTSYHVYPTRPWDDAPVHGADGLARQIYHAALGGCGRRCPFVGTDDGTGCLVAEAPIGSSAFIYESGFYTPYAAGGTRCPVGWDDGANCQIGRFTKGRDTPEIRKAPHFYVAPDADACPANATRDAVGCHIGSGPAGTTGFTYDPGSGLRFYHTARDIAPACPPPATFDGANCHVAVVPAGWTPQIVEQPHFYVAATTCGPNKPLHFGETGFSTFPNGVDLDPTYYAQGPARRQHKYDECVEDDGSMVAEHPAGTETEQVAFLSGGEPAGWPGLFPFSHACGFQGLHWWALGTVNWGICREDNFGLYAYWFLYQDAPPGGDVSALIERAGAAPFRDTVDYTQQPATHCDEPARFRDTLRADQGAPRYRFKGVVRDAAGAPVYGAMFYAWDHDWAGISMSFSDGDGRFEMLSDRCLVAGGVTHFGTNNDKRGFGDKCPTPTGAVIDVDLGGFTITPRADLASRESLAVPRERARRCLIDGSWVAAP